MRTLKKAQERGKGLLSILSSCLLIIPLATSLYSADLSAQLLDPPQVFEQGVTCPADDPDAGGFVCTSNDISITLVELSDITSCLEGTMATATFDIDLSVNANIRYNPMIWISENGLDPRSTGSSCFVSSVPDGPISHVDQLLFVDANQCADVDVPDNNFLLEDLGLGSVEFLCVDSDDDGLEQQRRGRLCTGRSIPDQPDAFQMRRFHGRDRHQG